MIGTLNFHTAEPREFTREQVQRFLTSANQTALAIGNARLAAKAAVVREMHHRIKIGLKTVVMVLRLQANLGRELAEALVGEDLNRILRLNRCRGAIQAIVRQTRSLGH